MSNLWKYDDSQQRNDKNGRTAGAAEKYLPELVSMHATVVDVGSRFQCEGWYRIVVARVIRHLMAGMEKRDKVSKVQ